MADLATIDDVAALLQRELTPLEITNGNRLLSMASSIVRKYCRQDFDLATNDVIVLPGNWTNVLELPQRPVISVSSVLFTGATSPNTIWKLDGSRLVFPTGAFMPDYGALVSTGGTLWGPAGSSSGMQASSISWQGPSAQITVTYTHGYAETPGDVTNVVAGMVALAIASPVGVNSETIGSYKVGYVRTEGGAMALQPSDKEALNLYRKRAMTTSIAPLR